MRLSPGTLRLRLATLSFGLLLAAAGILAVVMGNTHQQDLADSLRMRAAAIAEICAAQLRDSFAAHGSSDLGGAAKARVAAIVQAVDFRSIEMVGADGSVQLRVDHKPEAAVPSAGQRRRRPPTNHLPVSSASPQSAIAWAPLWPGSKRDWVRVEIDADAATEASASFLARALTLALLLAVGGGGLALFALRKPMRAIGRAGNAAASLDSASPGELVLDDDSAEIGQLERGLNRAARHLATGRADLDADRQRFLRLTEHLSELVFETDPEMRTLYLNPAWQELRRQPVEEMLGATLPELFNLENAQALGEQLRKLGDGEAHPLTVCVTTGDGEKRWLSVHISAMHDATRHTGFYGSAVDISAQRQVEQGLRESIDSAEEASRTKSAFLANMSHELRTPMNAIIGMTDLVLESSLDSEQRHFLTNARSAAENLLGIINDVLDFSKIEAGRLDFEQIPFGLRDCVEQAVSSHRENARSKGLVIDYRIDPTVPDALEGDPHRLRQVLQNLIGNAIKFTDAGHVVARVSAVSSDKNEALVHFAVEDTGIGIADDQQAWIFDAFSQVDATATRRHGGTGLGLSVAQRLVERMHGTIEVASKQGEGSTFSFNARFARTPEHSEDASTPPLESLQVMLAAESDFEIGHIAEGLISWQMRPEVETLGMRVLARMRHASSSDSPFHVLVLGDHLGDMDAFELSHRLRADPAIRPPVIILAASSGERGDAARCRSIGIDAYLTRPLQPLDLLDAIMSSLTRRRDGPLITRHSLREQRQSLQVLVAADGDRHMLTKVLERLGHVVHSVSNGVEAVESCHAARFDVIVLDALLGSPDALTVLVRLRAMETGSEPATPVIALAPDGYAELASSLSAAGADAMLRSPPATAALVAALRHLTTSATPAPAETSDEGEEGSEVLHVFDAKRALEYLDNDEDLLRQLIGVYLEGERGLRMRLREALAQGDLRAAHPALHAIGGSVGSFMAEATLAAVARIEGRCREGTATDMSAELQELWQEMDRLASALQELQEPAPSID